MFPVPPGVRPAIRALLTRKENVHQTIFGERVWPIAVRAKDESETQPTELIDSAIDRDGPIPDGTADASEDPTLLVCPMNRRSSGWGLIYEF
jgi:hypothetical protein